MNAVLTAYAQLKDRMQPLEDGIKTQDAIAAGLKPKMKSFIEGLEKSMLDPNIERLTAKLTKAIGEGGGKPPEGSFASMVKKAGADNKFITTLGDDALKSIKSEIPEILETLKGYQAPLAELANDPVETVNIAVHSTQVQVREGG